MSSSELFILDGPFLRHSPELIPSDLDFLSEPFFPFPDLPTGGSSFVSDIQSHFQSSPPCLPSSSLFQLSSSPPSLEMQGLSLGSPFTTANLSFNGVFDMNASDILEVKSESLDSIAFDLDEESLMQRSFSSHSLDHKSSFLLQPYFSFQRLHTEAPKSGENDSLGGSMRRVCSTGDLQKFNKMQPAHGSPNQQGYENSSCMEETGLRVGRYSQEERKLRIHRYRRKRTQRNFNKTIKYACRKTLADSRPRVRGRFARNDEVGEVPKAVGSETVDEDDEELWFDSLYDTGSPQLRYLESEFLMFHEKSS